MIDAETAAGILAIYRKHGWTLRRVLLSRAGAESLAENVVELFGDITIEMSELDALWFSRSSRPQTEAWELRHLGGRPFALVRVFDSDSDSSTISETLLAAEQEMLRTEKRR